jgi:hypothetical protein
MIIDSNLKRIGQTKDFIYLSTNISSAVITLLLLLSLPFFFQLANQLYILVSFLFYLPL